MISLKKILLYLVPFSLTPFICADPLVGKVNVIIPSDMHKPLAHAATALTSVLHRIDNASIEPTLYKTSVAVLAVGIGLYSAKGLFLDYPNRDTEKRTRMGWLVPSAGLTLSALMLWALKTNHL